MLSDAKRKAEESSTVGGSSDAALLTSPRVSPVKSRADREEEKRKKEEEASGTSSPRCGDAGPTPRRRDGVDGGRGPRGPGH